MNCDENYRDTALLHRGDFTESISAERLAKVFGNENVHRKVFINKTKSKDAGEIDVLVLFADRAIVVQCKSKRLTIEARKGNDRKLKDDFQKSVQDAYDQGWKCSNLLCGPGPRTVSCSGREIRIPTIKEVYIFCVISDNYPALNFQAQQFLRFEGSEAVRPPIVMDLFTLDAMAEMLDSPLYFLSYINRRTEYHGKLLARDELTILSYHLRKNLWLESDTDLMVMEDYVAAGLDVAMTVRRDGVPGKRTPEGILTRISDTVVGRLIRLINKNPNAQIVDFGFALLKLSENAVFRLGDAIEVIAQRARADGKNHDFSIPLRSMKSGLTVHCNDESIENAGRRLQRHCAVRKYADRANSWFGICLSSLFDAIRFGVSLSYVWEQKKELDPIVGTLAKPQDFASAIASARRPNKIGRNDRCPCGIKYKKCQLHKAYLR